MLFFIERPFFIKLKLDLGRSHIKKVDFAKRYADPLSSLRIKEKTHKINKDDRAPISEKTPWRIFGLFIEMMAQMSTRESNLSQIWE